MKFKRARFELNTKRWMLDRTIRLLSPSERGNLIDAVCAAAADGRPLPSGIGDLVRGVATGTIGWSRRNYKAVHIRDGKRCRYCASTSGPFSVDHVIPRAQGGDDGIGNLAVSCWGCNSRKGGRTPREAGMILLPSVAR